MTTDRQEMTPAPIRINVWRAFKALLLTLIVPLTAAVVIDLTTGMLPIVTIVAVVICIPVATIVVNRTVLSEFDRVVQMVAPELPPESTPEDASGEAAPVSDADASRS